MLLYEIDKRMQELLDTLVDNETGEINEEAEKELELLKADLPNAIEDFACYVKSEMAMLDALKTERNNISDRMESLTAKIDRHKESLARYTEGKPLNGARAVIRYRKTESVCIDDETDLSSFPEGLVDTTTIIKPNKAEIKAYIKNGGLLAGVKIVEKQSMSIK